MKRMGWSVGLALALLAGTAILLKAIGAAPAPPPETGTDPAGEGALKLHIHAKSPMIMGEPSAFQITLQNRSQVPITLVMPGDGSNCGWRTPLVGWSAVSAGDLAARHPDAPPLYRGPRCGNVNPLRKEEVFTLGPGQSKTLDGWAGAPHFTAPGSYKVVFYYSNDPAMTIRGVPLGQHEALELVKKSFKCALRSNELTVEVKAKN